MLLGSEVKSLRDGKANLVDSYAQHSERRSVPGQYAYQPLRRRQSVQSRADAHAQTFAARARDRTAHGQDQRARADADSAETLFQKRPGQGRVRPSARQKTLRQARDPQTQSRRARSRALAEVAALGAFGAVQGSKACPESFRRVQCQQSVARRRKSAIDVELLNH